MIVEPGFLDHWKTKLLVRKLGTETAPFCVLRLWQHCQERRKDRFTGMDPERLASVCGWTGDAKVLWDVMLETFVDRLEDGTIVVHDWARANAGLIAAWNNGRKGGRPKAQTADDDVPPVPLPTPEPEAEIPRPPPVDTVVELPPRFPRTESEAVIAAAMAGCPEAFAIETWNLAMSRNGRDSKGQPIASWPHHLKVQFQFNTNRREENVSRQRSGAGNNGQSPASRRRDLIAGSDDVERQAKLSTQRDREREESEANPFR